MESILAQAVARIAADNRTGAAVLTERAADLMLRRASTGEAASPDAFRQELLATGWALIHAQPMMAPIVNLVNTILWKLEQGETPESLRRAVAETTEHFKRQMKIRGLRVAEDAIGLIGEGSRIVTYSNSSTVQHALLHAQRAGRHFSVICAEARPACEGREMAAKLASHGIDVTLMVDMAVVAAVPEAQLVLVGADMLTPSGLVNKVGTRALALAAKISGVPIYSLCSSEKFLPLDYPMPIQLDQPGDEIWSNAPRNVRVRNRYYDTTPLQEISGIVTEQGVLPAATIEAWLAATKLHPALLTYAIEAAHI